MSKRRRGRSICVVWVVAGIVIIAVLLLVLAGRQQRPGAPRDVCALGSDGLHTFDSVSSWDSVFEIVVVTRRAFRGVWYGFELLSETGGALSIDGRTDLGQQFLAESYRFAGFDHDAVKRTLEQPHARTVCYKR